MKRKNNILFTDLQKFDLQKLQHAVTNFCKSVKFLYIKELSAKNVKMSKMSVEKTFLHAYAHTHAYTHIHIMREKIIDIFDILTFLEFILLIFSVLIDLQKLHFLIFHFCKS